MQLELLEQLLHRDFFPVKDLHHAVGVHAVGLLDEAQQVFLVHAGGRVDVSVYLPDRHGRRWRDVRHILYQFCIHCKRSASTSVVVLTLHYIENKFNFKVEHFSFH